jgi:hypothetical protein
LFTCSAEGNSDSGRVPRVFHSKVWIVHAVRPNMSFALVGSGNLSHGGLRGNIESSAYTQNKACLHQLTDWFDSLFSKAQPLTSDFVKYYEARYREARRKVSSADATVRRQETKIRQKYRVFEPPITKSGKQVPSDQPTYFILHTNGSNSEQDHNEMLRRHKASANCGKRQVIGRLGKNELVFL